MTLLFVVLTKNDSFRNWHIRAHMLNINTLAYTTIIVHMDMNYVHGCVRADAYNLISYYYAPWPWPCIYVLHMIRERHVILKVTLSV